MKLKEILQNEAVLCAAAVLAVGSMIAVPPDAAYWGYIDFRTLVLLFCLMASVAGLGEAGVFTRLAGIVGTYAKNIRILSLLLTLVCFFNAAIVTNDVALITFVPFTAAMLGGTDQKRLIYIIVVETIAANLGSLLTPMGNPQNLLLFGRFGYTVGVFLMEMLPLWGVSLAVCVVLALAVPTGGGMPKAEEQTASIDRKRAIGWAVGFIVSVLAVCGVCSEYVPLALVVILAVVLRGRTIAAVDYSLLATFVCFFIFVGNIARIDAIGNWIQELLVGRELVVSALASQVISNVPAAAMLVGFTDASRALLYGVNIGGLGTLIASMASLISFRRYCAVEGAQRGKYMLVFSVMNFVLLAVFMLFGLTIV